MRNDLDKVIGGVYKYPDGKKHFTLKEVNGYVCKFECGHWCTDCVFEDLIFIGKQLEIYGVTASECFPDLPKQQGLT